MSKTVDSALHDPEARLAYEQELLLGEAIETLGALASGRITQRELAGRLGVTEGRVSQILSGGENLTLRSLAALGWALGLRFQLHPIPLADRQGTPAEDDEPLPSWLDRFSLVSPAEFERLAPAKEFEPYREPMVVVSANRSGQPIHDQALPIAA